MPRRSDDLARAERRWRRMRLLRTRRRRPWGRWLLGLLLVAGAGLATWVFFTGTA